VKRSRRERVRAGVSRGGEQKMVVNVFNITAVEVQSREVSICGHSLGAQSRERFNGGKTGWRESGSS
jgi:hypothetical protein